MVLRTGMCAGQPLLPVVGVDPSVAEGSAVLLWADPLLLDPSALLLSPSQYLTAWLPAPQIDFMPESDARCLFQQLIVAVDYCHKLGIANRDIKVRCGLGRHLTPTQTTVCTP